MDRRRLLCPVGCNACNIACRPGLLGRSIEPIGVESAARHNFNRRHEHSPRFAMIRLWLSLVLDAGVLQAKEPTMRNSSISPWLKSLCVSAPIVVRAGFQVPPSRTLSERICAGCLTVPSRVVRLESCGSWRVAGC